MLGDIIPTVIETVAETDPEAESVIVVGQMIITGKKGECHKIRFSSGLHIHISLEQSIWTTKKIS